MNILAVDIGGTHVKLRSQRHEGVVKIASGPKMTPDVMMQGIRAATAGWKFDRVSIGYPGVVVHNLPLADPHNLGKGWVCFDYVKAFGGLPLRMINDAAMQALGSYTGGRMLFLGLGTGLGSALVVDGVVQSMELAHLPWKKGKTYEEFLGEAALEKHGLKHWRRNVTKAIAQLEAAMGCDHVVLGGGNADKVKHPADYVTLGSNENAFKGAFMLWQKPHSASR